MGRTSTAFRDVLRVIKDKVAQSKAALLSNPDGAALPLLRATTHSPPTPPDGHRLSAILLLGQGSRAAASPIITRLMDRLHRTGSCVVALKCLLLVHHIIRRGPFILQDQLSIFPAAGGHNYLKLSSFRDGATAAAWALSRWVRWYARYLETLISASRVVGYFVCSSSTSHQEGQDLRVSSSSNSDLIKEIDSLALLIEEIGKLPDSFVPKGSDLLVKEIMGLVTSDYLSCVNEVVLRLVEASERLDCLTVDDSLELVCALRKLQHCREKLSMIYGMNKPSIDMMWGSIEGFLKDRDEVFKLHNRGWRLLRESAGLGYGHSVSARLGERVVGIRSESVLFQSQRFESDRFTRFLPLDESIQPL